MGGRNPTTPVPVSADFDVPAFFKSAGISHRTARFAAGSRLFAQGAQANSVFYIERGSVKLSVLSAGGKEAVVAMLGAADFVGEGCLAGQAVRIATATAVSPTTALRIAKADMIRALREHADFSDRFISHARESGLKKISSINSSTPARSGWPERSCSSLATE